MNKFNKLVGFIFGKLYEEFPVPLELEPNLFFGKMAEDLDEEGEFNFPDYFDSTVRWLETAGYIWMPVDKSSYDGPSYDVVLSEKGLEALRRVPVSLEGNASIGERLATFSKTKASETLSTLISLAITTAVQGTSNVP